MKSAASIWKLNPMIDIFNYMDSYKVIEEIYLKLHKVDI